MLNLYSPSNDVAVYTRWSVTCDHENILETTATGGNKGTRSRL
ncbi:MAG: hypothetical protein AVDCRST_MAG93-8575 [uncultured Chloroflexia bacterium]|uniref:Uncharacterized protein n=1 Tax=uncultured Chloroflexia bacterium TaxID=1672391 RepID=A0A6J4N4R7_9CHLR|nr:MAG: hypothetical protein AVDCRST_MAG93-8575 [uncultured Chloroflexia bacterium]